jgi:hypothetical protein
MLYKMNLLVYVAQIVILDVNVALELDYLLSRENVFMNGDTTTRVLNRMNTS